MPVPLVLASSSPRRREILSSLGLVFTIAHADLDETPFPGESAHDAALRLAREKADKVSAQYPAALVVGADTLVTLDGNILGKPDDAAHAEEMLVQLAGRAHEVVTGVAVKKADEGFGDSGIGRSTVVFKALSREEIARYAASGEPVGKAGAYAIQGLGGALIERYDGSYSNIVGLPVTELLRLLMGFGVDRLEWADPA
ncbi:MAG: septum formation inhibitor Maf [Nitrospinae bacterium]|nr:septum formation inhibitor Maf [Nitrospinota bacterium]